MKTDDTNGGVRASVARPRPALASRTPLEVSMLAVLSSASCAVSLHKSPRFRNA